MDNNSGGSSSNSVAIVAIVGVALALARGFFFMQQGDSGKSPAQSAGEAVKSAGDAVSEGAEEVKESTSFELKTDEGSIGFESKE